MMSVMSTLYCMLKNEKYKEAENSVKNLCATLQNCQELPQPTGNEGLDGALMATVSECREKDVSFSYVVLGTPKIDCVEMGILMENLLCNGVEACLKVQGKREIELVVRDIGTGVEVLMENSIAGSVLRDNPNLHSLKSDEKSHGFGMESIYGIVRKYVGEYECWEEDGRFCQGIYLRYGENNWFGD